MAEISSRDAFFLLAACAAAEADALHLALFRLAYECMMLCVGVQTKELPTCRTLRIWVSTVAEISSRDAFFLLAACAAAVADALLLALPTIAAALWLP